MTNPHLAPLVFIVLCIKEDRVMYQFLPKTTQILQKYGWSSDRQVDTEPYEKYFTSTGQPISELMLTFLASFGGLKVFTETCTQAELENDDCDRLFEVDPLYHTDPDFVLSFYRKKKVFQKPIALIGMYDNDQLAMTSDGEFFTMFDSHVNRIGYSVRQAIESICETNWYEAVLRRPQ